MEEPTLPNKKPRLSRNIVDKHCSERGDERWQSCEGFDSLGSILVERIVSFLSPAELLGLSVCSQRFRQHINHEHVVTCAMLNGGQTERTVTMVLDMAVPSKSGDQSTATIHFPTPIRLLRLINGTKCESPECSSSVTTAIPHFGLFLCWNCFLDITTPIELGNAVIVNEKRIARFVYMGSAHVLKTPFIDTSGERAGPIVSWDVASGAVENKDVEGVLKEADKSYTLAVYEGIRRCIRENKNQGRASRNCLRTPISNARTLMRRLQEMLENRQCLSSDVLCSFQERPQLAADGALSDHPCVVLDSNMVHELLASLIESPSQASERQLEEMADNLVQAVQTLTETGFLDFSFLDENNPWENELRKHFQAQTQPDFALRSVNCDMLEDVRQGDMFGALHWLENSYRIAPPNDPQRQIGDWAGVFANFVLEQHSNVVRQYPLITRDCARDLARVLYIEIVGERSSAMEETAAADDDDSLEDDARAEFTRLCNQAAVVFQETLPSTQALIERINTDAHLVEHIEPRARRAFRKSILAQMGKLRREVVARLRNREFASIIDELRLLRG